MHHDAKLPHGTPSADMSISCSLAVWLFSPLPLPLGTPMHLMYVVMARGRASTAAWHRIGTPASSWGQGQLCRPHAHDMPLMGLSRMWSLVFEQPNSFFLDILHQRGQMTSILLPLERIKMLLARVPLCSWVLMGALTYKGVSKCWEVSIKMKGKIAKEGRTDRDGFNIMLHAKSCY